MSHTTIVLNENIGFFPRKIQVEGKEYPVVTCSMSNAFDETDRLRYLLTKLVFEEDIDVELLNRIGFSKDDANNISMEIPGLKFETPPEWKE